VKTEITTEGEIILLQISAKPYLKKEDKKIIGEFGSES